jgi:raffinose/stachyose/melibiose transport system permease protein
MMATYQFMSWLKLTNTFWGVFLMSSGGIGFSFLMFRGFFASIPWEFAESGFIDGASNFRAFWSIMMPQARSIIISILIVSFIGAWNDYFTPYLYLAKNPTIALYVQLLSVNQRFKVNYPLQMSVLVFMVGVVLIIYAFFSKRIMESMSAGGLKG